MALEENGLSDPTQNQMAYLASLENTKDPAKEPDEARCAAACSLPRSLRKRRPMESREASRYEHGLSEQNAGGMGSQKPS